jgi:ketosteroid isomerase-like protein
VRVAHRLVLGAAESRGEAEAPGIPVTTTAGEFLVGAQDNAATVAAFFEAFNAYDAEEAITRCTPEVEIVNVPTGDVFRGPNGIRQFFAYWTTAFPDAVTLTNATIADKDDTVVEFVGRGTHLGPLSGPDGTIEPTGRTVSLEFVAVHRLRNAKIIRLRL